ncbi:hypothetical protein L917_15315 [Phytophthora nicotianae]|uniref:RxLR effector protein n=1 Tax=Phytophthora nicotianae TaxID=4792 RepID=W2G7V6_PHYNI|nr:hypothetical protein L915_15601 [Phytophthora nicotianae]ETL85012.1 hypothetical protein L917_15315 [Phytophthora nicotianae]
MRLISFLLVAAAALFTDCNGVPTASLTKLSGNAVQPINVASEKSVKSLRSESRISTDIENSEDEERGIKVGLVDDAVKKLGGADDAAKKLLINDNVRLAAEAKAIDDLVDWWTTLKLTPKQIKSRVTKTSVRDKALKQYLAQIMREKYALNPRVRTKTIARP